MDVMIRLAKKIDTFAVHRLLSKSSLNSRSLSLDARRRMFEGVWGGEDTSPGYVMEAEGRVVGFMGTLFTNRRIKGKVHKFCEIHSWYVEAPYRNQSLLLLMPALSNRNVTLLNYTPTPAVHEIGKKFGFQDLEKNLVLLYPAPTGFARLTIIRDKARIPDYLSKEDARIFYDHRDVECHHMIVLVSGRPSSPLYLIIKSMRRRWFEPFGRVLYASDKQAFTQLASALRWRLCLRHRWQCLVADERDMDIPNLPRFSRLLKREVPSQFKSKTLQAEEIAPLYTLPLLIGYRLH
ncbi:hypothetical protein WGT02_32090 (plasmid) [Rhizobium sp. T1470]|uniref:hypothetical protein n=1 Tax=unclassified Rhizobium TaxID=2613769 RepID=UPI001AAF22E8|nr:hypothetical protein [Rhizobium sp. T1473]MCA0806504.1 hypothetical protein [Rhizobium sp. T1473]